MATKSFSNNVKITNDTLNKFKKSITKNKTITVTDSKNTKNITSYKEALQSLGINKHDR